MFLPSEIPPSAKEDCDDPVELPDRKLLEQEATPLWAKDRTALRECGIKNRALKNVIGASQPTPAGRE